MRIIYFGSSEFAVKPLEALLKTRHEVRLVVTQPDRPKGRGLKCLPTPVKTAASEKSIEVFEPEDFSPGAREFLLSRNADLFVVIAYGRILPESVISIPKICSINLHASLLPKYRGAAPVNWALINGESKSGITVIRMNARMDAGDIVAQETAVIEGHDDAVTLSSRLSIVGSAKILEVLDGFETGRLDFIRQDEKEASFAPKLKKSDGVIDWRKSAAAIYNRWRGLINWPCSRAVYKGVSVKIWKGEPSFDDISGVSPGEIVKADKGGIAVQSGSGLFIIKELQPQDSRRMRAEEFIAGYRVKKGDRFA